jgi:hypothetical protein
VGCDRHSIATGIDSLGLLNARPHWCLIGLAGASVISLPTWRAGARADSVNRTTTQNVWLAEAGSRFFFSTACYTAPLVLRAEQTGAERLLWRCWRHP